MKLSHLKCKAFKGQKHSSSVVCEDNIFHFEKNEVCLKFFDINLDESKSLCKKDRLTAIFTRLQVKLQK